MPLLILNQAENENYFKFLLLMILIYTFISLKFPKPLITIYYYYLLFIEHLESLTEEKIPWFIMKLDGITPQDKKYTVLYVQEVVTQPKILNRTILSNLIHVT